MKSLFDKQNWQSTTLNFDLIPDEALSFAHLIGVSGNGSDNRDKRTIYKKLVMGAYRTYLNDEQKDLVNKYYFEQKTIYQLADELNISPSAVSKRLNKAKTTIHSFASACINSGLFSDC